MKLLKPMTALLCSLLLSGCFDVNQEIWINSDGSGRLRFDMGLSKKLADLGEEDASGIDDLADRFKELGRELAGDPRLLHSPVVEEYGDDDFDRVAIELTVKDWRDLSVINRMIVQKRPGEEAAGNGSNRLFVFTLEESDDGNIYYRQPSSGFRSESKQPDEEKEEGFFEGMGRALVGAFMSEGGLTVTLHSPTISLSNGDWQSDRASVQWTVALEDLINDKVEVDAFTAEIGAPAGSLYFWRVVGVLLVVSFLVGLLVWFRRYRSRPPSADTPVS